MSSETKTVVCWKPTREEVLKASTKEDLASVRDALLVWQTELDHRDSQSKKEKVPTQTPTSTPPPCDDSEKPPCDEFEDEFVVVDSRVSPPEQQQKQAPSLTSSLLGAIGKTPYSCSVAGCTRIVLRADSSLHMCSLCRRSFCAEHSGKLSIAISEATSTARALCDECSALVTWTPGFTSDRTNHFAKIRTRFVSAAAAEASDWRASCSQGIEALILAAQAHQQKQQQAQQQQTLIAPLVPVAVEVGGLVKGVVGSVFASPQSWGSCSVCGVAFGRLSVRRTCSLCRKDVCFSCGIADVSIGATVAGRVLGRQFRGPAPSSAKCCAVCSMFLNRERVGAMLEREQNSTGPEPEWRRRHDECLRLAEGIQAQTSMLREMPEDVGPTGEAQQQLCTTVTAMIIELQDATSWFSVLEHSVAQSSPTQCRVLRSIRRRIFADIYEAKEQLIRHKCSVATVPIVQSPSLSSSSISPTVTSQPQPQ